MREVADEATLETGGVVDDAQPMCGHSIDVNLNVAVVAVRSTCKCSNLRLRSYAIKNRGGCPVTICRDTCVGMQEIEN